MGYTRGNKRLSRRCCASCCVHSARVSCKDSRFKAVHVRGFVGIIGSFHHIIFAAVGVVGDGGVFDENKVQVGGGSQILQIIGVNGIAVRIGGLDPFPLFLFVCQAAGILNHVSCQLQKHSFRVTVFILRCVRDTDELTADIGIRFRYNRLNFQLFAIGDIGCQIATYGHFVAAVRAFSFRCAVAAANRGAAGQGMIKLEVDVVQEVAVGPSLIIFTSHRHKGEYRFCLTRRDGVQIILAQIHTFAA